MFFPFTFSLNTPFANPFNPPAPADAADPGQLDYGSPQRTRARRPPPPRRPIPQPTPERSGLTRKRGRWSPDVKTRASSPVADVTSTASAYIDTYGKSVDLGTNDRTDLDADGVLNELRPVKRRRIVEITDSLISTAFSAAVIGTAVGLTAYRLWRDRGKDGLPSTPSPDPALENLPPPPPYTERPERMHMQPTAGPSYVPGGVPAPAPTSTPVNRRTKARPSTTGRRAQAQGVRRRRPVSTVYPRNQSPAVSLHRPATSYHTAPNSAHSTPGPSSLTQPHAVDAQSGDELDDDEMEISGQMDWMSSQLQNLINEGKKALGAEVVVGGADEVDDGAEGWEEDEPVVTPSRAYSTTSSGATRTVPRVPALGRSTSRTSNVARLKNSHQRSSSGCSTRKPEDYEDEHGFEVLYQTPLRSAPAAKTTFSSTDDGASEELRVAMERVRKAYGLK